MWGVFQKKGTFCPHATKNSEASGNLNVSVGVDPRYVLMIGKYLCSGVCSLKELWEGKGNSHSHKSDTVMGTVREAGIIL